MIKLNKRRFDLLYNEKKTAFMRTCLTQIINSFPAVTVVVIRVRYCNISCNSRYNIELYITFF